MLSLDSVHVIHGSAFTTRRGENVLVAGPPAIGKTTTILRLSKLSAKPLEAGFVILGLKDGKAFIVTTGTQSMAFGKNRISGVFRKWAMTMEGRTEPNLVKRGLANVAREFIKTVAIVTAKSRSRETHAPRLLRLHKAIVFSGRHYATHGISFHARGSEKLGEADLKELVESGGASCEIMPIPDSRVGVAKAIARHA